MIKENLWEKLNLKTISRRTFLKIFGYIKALIVTFFMTSVLPNKTLRHAFAVVVKKKVRLGVLCPSHCAIPIVYAHIGEVYKKYGLESEIVYLHGMFDISKGIVSGELQGGQLITPVFFSIHKGIGPFKAIKTSMVTTQVLGTNGGVLSVAKGREIKSVLDLKGKTIGVHSPFTTHMVLLKLILEKAGLDPTRDIQIKIINFQKIISAMKNGEIDAFIHPEPLATAASNMGVAMDLMLTKNVWYKHPCCLLSMAKDFLEKEKETARLITLATLEAGLLTNNYKTRDSVINLVHNLSAPYSKVEKAILKRAFMPGRSDFDPFPFQSSAQALLYLMKKNSILPVDIDIQSTAKETFLSNYSREIFKELEAPQIPPENNRIEILAGEKIG